MLLILLNFFAKWIGKRMLKENVYYLTLGNINFGVQFQSPLTLHQYFSDFCKLRGDMDTQEIISVSSEEIADRKKDFGSEPFTEFNLLLEHFCNQLLPYDRCLFHSVGICADNQAWLITAPSGTGKSTQYRNWKALFGDEVQLICGDKPILEFQNSGDIIVHPSPWRGKERWRGSSPAKLSGVVYLEQGLYNEISLMSASDALVPLYTQFLYQPETETQLRQVASMLDRMVSQIPVWKLVNTGDKASARLTYDTICGKKGS